MTDTSRERLDAIGKALAKRPGVTRETRKGFGSGALKIRGKIFVMVSADNHFVAKLPKARVEELVAAGVGKQFEPGPGRVMKEWLSMATEARNPNWLELAKEALAFVGKT